MDACFVVPSHGRHEMLEVCMNGMRWTCDVLRSRRIDCSVVIVSEEDFAGELAQELDFHWVQQSNISLGRKFNDGIQFAMETLKSDLAIMSGSDDIVHPDLVMKHVEARRTGERWVVGSSRTTSVVNENGTQLAELEITYDGGDGVRALPKEILALVNNRPADDWKKRAMDTSMKKGIEETRGEKLEFAYRDIRPIQIVDFKSPSDNLNNWQDCANAFGTRISDTPWHDLTAMWPESIVSKIRQVYAWRNTEDIRNG